MGVYMYVCTFFVYGVGFGYLDLLGCEGGWNGSREGEEERM